jgi:REP element-mobilizing transposase RayT
MKYNREIHHRQSMRLKGFDYASPGYYFITICAQNRECFFGNISQGILELNDAGEMIKDGWKNLTQRFNHILLENYVIMPNHLHGIIHIKGSQPFQTINDYFKDREKIINNTELINPPSGTLKNSISRIIQAFKSISTNRYIESVRIHNWPPFEKHLWQNNFYDYIIRNMKELCEIRRYIKNNPINWESDEYNPINLKK